VLAVGLPLLLLDGAFFSANLLKIRNGGWFPLLLGVLIFTVMTTWHRGRRLVRRQAQRDTPTMDDFLIGLSRNPPRVVAGTAVFLSAHAGTAPPALRLGLRSFGAVHQCNIIVRARTLDVPFVDPASCASWEQLSASFYTATLRFGYMQAPDIPAALARTAPPSLGLDISSVTYFLSDQPIFVTRRLGLALWRERLFAFLSRNAPSMLGTYRLPPAQVVEMNTPREI